MEDPPKIIANITNQNTDNENQEINQEKEKDNKEGQNDEEKEKKDELQGDHPRKIFLYSVKDFPVFQIHFYF